MNKVKLSIIVCTHNRAGLLNKTLKDILDSSLDIDYGTEVVVIDNNSTDHTRDVVNKYKKRYPNLKYVFEPRTSLSRARNTGRHHSKGEYLLYLDDDLMVSPGSFRSVIEIFDKYNDCGIIAGGLNPKYLVKPPNWIYKVQKSFNGLSLFNSEVMPSINKDFQEVFSAVGSMMAIRAKIFHQTGDFPAETMGVETNLQEGSFRRLFVGPGDYGMCILARRAKYKIYYSKDVSSLHLIPAARLTVAFWRSRVMGEGQYEAISRRCFFHDTPLALSIKSIIRRLLYLRYRSKFFHNLTNRAIQKDVYLSQEELMLHYHRSYIEMDWVLQRNKTLAKFLWKLASDGVVNTDYEKVFSKFPAEYKILLHPKNYYNDTEISSRKQYKDNFELLKNDIYNEKIYDKFLYFLVLLYKVYHTVNGAKKFIQRYKS